MKKIIIVVAIVIVIGLAYLIIKPKLLAASKPGAVDAVITEPTKIFTIEEVAAHNTKDSCYLAVGGKVYDVTPYIALGMHKAGVQVIIDKCGGDATEAFSVSHSGKPKAAKMLAGYYIGSLQ